MSNPEIAFCAYPSAFIYDKRGEKAVSNRKKHLFWGDTIEVGKRVGGWREVASREVGGWMEEADLQHGPLLDIIFLDVGQGDSCFIVTPEDDKIIVDAGAGDNLVRYLRWRYRRFESREMKAMGGKVKAFILSHPDEDHYGGLAALFDPDVLGTAIKVETVFHNGLFPLKGDFGKAYKPERIDGKDYLPPVVSREDLDRHLGDNAVALNQFSTLVARIRRRFPRTEFRMLYEGCGERVVSNVPGLSVAILAPVLEACGGKRGLRVLTRDSGICKNGHSVVLRVDYRNVRILLSGDLNAPAQSQLLQHYAGRREAFGADVLKAPHHGSSDFLDDFVRAVNPVVSIISSGDNEGYSHPRADALGRLGKMSRDDRPLVFSTELGRSFKVEKRSKAATAKARAGAGPTPDAEKAKDRLVAVYGAVNLRTDGCRVVMCQKKEAPDSQRREWDLYRLEPRDGGGPLASVPA